MNEAAQLVSDSLIGEDFVTIRVGKKAYTVYPPAIKVICRATSVFSKIGMDGEYSKLSVLAELPDNVPLIIQGISAIIVGDVMCWKWKAHKVGRRLERLSLPELKELVDNILPLLGGDAFFVCAASLKSLSGIAAKAK